jgi:hypothetical protein
MTLVGVHDESGTVIIHCEREVISNGLMEIKSRRPAERSGQICSLLVNQIGHL